MRFWVVQSKACLFASGVAAGAQNVSVSLSDKEVARSVILRQDGPSMGSEANGSFQQRAWQLPVGPPELQQSLVVAKSDGANDNFFIKETWLASDGSVGDVVQEQRTPKKTKR